MFSFCFPKNLCFTEKYCETANVFNSWVPCSFLQNSQLSHILIKLHHAVGGEPVFKMPNNLFIYDSVHL